MEQPALWLSTTYLTVKLAVALWAGQLATIILTRGQANLGRSMALAIASLPIAIQAWRVQSPGTRETSIGPLSPSLLWLIAAIVAAVTLVDCLRRWVASTDQIAAREIEARNSGSPTRAYSVSGLMLAIVGLLITLLAVVSAQPRSLSVLASTQRLAISQTLLWTVMSGVTIATTLELTLGKTGQALAQQAWRPLSIAALIALIGQIAMSLLIILRLRAAESIEDAMMPVVYAIGLSIVGYIVWAIPNRTATHAAKPPFRDHLSLAISGWIAILCLALAATLPNDWPWKVAV